LHLQVGDTIQFERTFTKDDVKIFTEVSKDKGEHHREPDELDRLVVQGLLTATLPTKVGGDYNVLARTMHFEFLRPVFTGDTIRCDVKVEQLEMKVPDRTSILANFHCTNQHEKEVLNGYFSGVILTEAS